MAGVFEDLDVQVDQWSPDGNRRIMCHLKCNSDIVGRIAFAEVVRLNPSVRLTLRRRTHVMAEYDPAAPPKRPTGLDRERD